MSKVAAVDSSSLITNIVRDCRARQQGSKYVDCTLSIGKSSLLMSDRAHFPPNVSKVSTRWVAAFVDNTTGEVRILTKPLFFTQARAEKSIRLFLEQIQPDRLASAKVLKDDSPLKKSPDTNIVLQTLGKGRQKIQRWFVGYNEA